VNTEEHKQMSAKQKLKPVLQVYALFCSIYENVVRHLHSAFSLRHIIFDSILCGKCWWYRLYCNIA